MSFSGFPSAPFHGSPGTLDERGFDEGGGGLRIPFVARRQQWTDIRHELGRVAACAGYTRVNRATAEAGARISWVVTQPAANGQQQVACRSALTTDCELAPSTSAAKKFASAYLYLHPSTTGAVTHRGTMRVAFFNGFAPDLHEGTIEALVRPGDPPFDVSVIGPVTPIPGVYRATIDLVAMSAAGFSEAIRDNLTVAVR